MSDADGELTVVVIRKIKPGCEAAFEDAMLEFATEAWRFPGHMGMQMLRSVETISSREYTVIARFESLDARRTFTASPFYEKWMERLSELSDGGPMIREFTGIEGLFSSGNAPGSPPKWKMAVTVWLGVFTFSQALYLLLSPWIGTWARPAQAAVVSAAVVAILTWIVLPWLTRRLHGWYFPRRSKP